jgi:MYXO-CTERM domain-containing protein
MNRFANTIARAGAALGLALGLALPAAATPVYHVTVDTSSLAGQEGYLDFLILTLADAGRVHATIGSISDQAPGPVIESGDFSSDGPYVTIGNGQGWNEFGQWIHFDDQLSFNLAFALDPTDASTSSAYTTLQVALVGDDQVSYLGFNQDLADFDLRYGEAPGVSALDGIATVTQVPEAPALWLSLTGLGLIAALRRRAPRARAARHALQAA